MSEPNWTRRGIGRTEVIVIVGVVVAVVVMGCLGTALMAGLLLPALAKAQRNARTLQDAAQIREVYAGTVLYAQSFGPPFPTPGLVASGQDQSEEDYTLNHSASFYSMLVVQNYVSPEILVGTTEVNPAIAVKRDYDYESYDPVAGVYWDPSFVMHIHDPSVGANGSYAHLALIGDRMSRWSGAGDPSLPVFSTRGVKGGLGPGNPEYDRSPTLRLHGRTREWTGNVLFGDGHHELWNTFSAAPTVYDDGSGPRPDNIFAAEFKGGQAAGDVFLGVFISATEFTVEDVYDPLE